MTYAYKTVLLQKALKLQRLAELLRSSARTESGDLIVDRRAASGILGEVIEKKIEEPEIGVEGPCETDSRKSP